MRVRHRLTDLHHDIAYAVRQLLAAPAFTGVAVATLAIGIGATTAIFSAVNSVVLRPLPVPEPDRIVVVGETWQNSRGGNVSVGNFVDMAAEQTVFEAVAAATVVNATLSRESAAERTLVGRVSAAFFEVFRTQAERGRVFTAAEDQPGRDPVVVLGHRFWTGQLGADPAIVGKTLVLNGRAHAIIGVMPAAFDFTADSEAMWVPAAFTPAERAQHDEHYLDVYGRLRPGVSMEQAQHELAAIGAGLAKRFPNENGDRTLSVTPMMDSFISDYRDRMLVLLGAVTLVLLIACGNVSNLLLARGASRARELAVRSALGAGRGRLVRQLLTESLVLGLASAAAGAVLARMLIGLLVSAAPDGVPRLDQASLDGVALAFAATLGLASSVVFGLVPAWRAARIDIVRSLREAVRGAGGRHGRDLVRSLLIGGEIALAAILLVGAGLLIRSAIEMRRLDPGFRPDGSVFGTSDAGRLEAGRRRLVADRARHRSRRRGDSRRACRSGVDGRPRFRQLLQRRPARGRGPYDAERARQPVALCLGRIHANAAAAADPRSRFSGDRPRRRAVRHDRQRTPRQTALPQSESDRPRRALL